MYYFGGQPNDRFVHKFNCETNVTVRLTTALPSSIYIPGGVSINGTIFIFNGQGRNILEFNDKSETVKIIGDLPFQSGTSTVSSITAISNGQDGVWLFAGNSPKATNPVLLFNTANKAVNIPTANSTSLQTLYYHTASVWDGSHGYLIGGFGRVQESDGSYHPTIGILT
jgi:hypothetical protein